MSLSCQVLKQNLDLCFASWLENIPCLYAFGSVSDAIRAHFFTLMKHLENVLINETVPPKEQLSCF